MNASVINVDPREVRNANGMSERDDNLNKVGTGRICSIEIR